MGDVIVASTSDTQEEVNAAAGGKPQDETIPPAKAAPTGDEQIESQDPEEKVAPEKLEEKLEEKPAPKNLSKKFDKLYREKKELEERVAAMEAKQNGTQPEPKVEVPTEVTAKFDTFDGWSEKQIQAGKPASIDDFLEARDAWKEARDAQKAEREAAKQVQVEIDTTYQERIDAFVAEHPDWKEVVGESDLSIPTAVGVAIKELENAPEVVWHLATHPEEAKKFNKMSPYAAVAYVGKISAQLEKPAAEETQTNNITQRSPDRTPTVSKAPAPIASLKGGSMRPTKDLAAPDISYEDYRKIRDEQTKSRFRR